MALSYNKKDFKIMYKQLMVTFGFGCHAIAHITNSTRIPLRSVLKYKGNVLISDHKIPKDYEKIYDRAC